MDRIKKCILVACALIIAPPHYHLFAMTQTIQPDTQEEYGDDEYEEEEYEDEEETEYEQEDAPPPAKAPVMPLTKTKSFAQVPVKASKPPYKKQAPVAKKTIPLKKKVIPIKNPVPVKQAPPLVKQPIRTTKNPPAPTALAKKQRAPQPIKTTPPTKAPSIKKVSPRKTTIAQTPQATQKAKPLQQTHAVELEKINQTLKTIDTLKDTLKGLLEQFDQAIEKGRALAVQARTKSMEILKSKTKADAQKIKTQIKKDFEALKKMQQNLQKNLESNFQTTAKQIQSNITNVEKSIKELQQKGVSIKLSQTKTEKKKTKEKKSTFLARLKKKVAITEKKKDESFGSYLTRRTSDLALGVIGLFYTTYKAIKDLFFKEKEMPQKKLGPKQTPTPMPSEMPRKTMPSANAEGIVAKYDQLMTKLQANRLTLEKQTQQLDATVMTLRKALEHDQTVGKHIDDQSQWKESILSSVSWAIDSTIYIARSTLSGAQKMFHYYIKPAAKKITHDVQKKIQEEEKLSQKISKAVQQEEHTVKKQPAPRLPQVQ